MLLLIYFQFKLPGQVVDPPGFRRVLVVFETDDIAGDIGYEATFFVDDHRNENA